MKIQVNYKKSILTNLAIIAILVGISFLIPNYKGNLTIKIVMTVAIIIYMFFNELKWKPFQITDDKDFLDIEFRYFIFNSKMRRLDKKEVVFFEKKVTFGKYNTQKLIYCLGDNINKTIEIDSSDGWNMDDVRIFFERAMAR